MPPPTKRVGELLLERDRLDWELLARALHDQRGSGLRLCSFLIARGELSFDEAAQVLGRQLGAAAVLKRHLARRDRRLAALLDPDVARANTALPVGRMSDGALIVAVRDPSERMRAALARVLRGPIVLAVAPAGFIERLVEQTYPRDVHVPIDVELPPEASGFDIEIDDGAGADDDGAGAVDDADDVPIDVELPAAPAEPIHRPLPVEIRPVSEPGATPRDALDATIAALADVDELDWLLDVVMGYAAQRWRAAVLLAVTGGRATGVRGHGPAAPPDRVRALAVELAGAPLVRGARDEHRVVGGLTGAGALEPRGLAALLDDPAAPAAAPIRRGDAVPYVLAVGDPRSGDPERAALDLEVLAEGAAVALERL